MIDESLPGRLGKHVMFDDFAETAAQTGAEFQILAVGTDPSAPVSLHQPSGAPDVVVSGFGEEKNTILELRQAIKRHLGILPVAYRHADALLPGQFQKRSAEHILNAVLHCKNIIGFSYFPEGIEAPDGEIVQRKIKIRNQKAGSLVRGVIPRVFSRYLVFVFQYDALHRGFFRTGEPLHEIQMGSRDSGYGIVINRFEPAGIPQKNRALSAVSDDNIPAAEPGGFSYEILIRFPELVQKNLRVAGGSILYEVRHSEDAHRQLPVRCGIGGEQIMAVNPPPSDRSLLRNSGDSEATTTQTITVTGKPSTAQAAKYYKYKNYTKTWKNYCPFCKKTGTLANNPKGVAEGEITCHKKKGGCDADFDITTGGDKSGSYRKYLVDVNGKSNTKTKVY